MRYLLILLFMLNSIAFATYIPSFNQRTNPATSDKFVIDVGDGTTTNYLQLDDLDTYIEENFTLLPAVITASEVVTTGMTIAEATNADTLDSQQGTYYLDLGNATGTLALARLNTSVVTDNYGNEVTLDENLLFDTASLTNGQARGIVRTVTVDANSTGIGALLHKDTDGNYIEADADAKTTIPCTAIALETGTGSKKVLFYGWIRNTGWSYTVGDELYVSTNVGTATQDTDGFTTGDYVQIIGIADTTDTIYFNPEMGSDKVQ
jgi:hypothetical protein